MRNIKTLRNNRKVVFDQGKFDNWCVYVVEENNTKRPPFDVDYFTELKEIDAKYGNGKVYSDFVKIYSLTTDEVNLEVCALIDEIVLTYNDEDQTIIEQWFAVIYGGMIAEENKSFSVLKKRIKHLGIHQTLVQGLDPQISAKFSYGKKWRELDAIMNQYGI